MRSVASSVVRRARRSVGHTGRGRNLRTAWIVSGGPSRGGMHSDFNKHTRNHSTNSGGGGGSPFSDPLKKARSSVMFTLDDTEGALNEVLGLFAEHKVNMTRIESRPSKTDSDVNFYVDFQGSTEEERVQELIHVLREHCKTVTMLQSRKVPWFPRKVRELDTFATKTMEAGDDLESDHPGFNDAVYRKRRQELARVARDLRHGESIPRVSYTAEEVATWSTVYDRQMGLVEDFACAEYLRLLPLLKENCGYSRDQIPQLQDVSEFLQECTGFTLRPVCGLLSARNFLYGLAFRVFFSTQYIRHHSKPLYTPEPDICHELMGHAPLFADQKFAEFSQEIGLAAIGATDEQVLKLARCYWFTVEFGLCKQDGIRKAYGAGLLSSFGELEYAMSDKPEVREFDPCVAGEMDYPITTYQPVYFEAASFDDATTRLRVYAESFSRPFGVRYNPYTQSLDVDANVEREEPAENSSEA